MISISALCIDGKGFRSRVSGVRDCRLSFTCQQPGCRQAVTRSRINSFQTQFLIIKWPNLGHETSATLPFHMWSSYSMPCLNQPTTNCAVEIRETSWATALFAVVVSSMMTSQRRFSCSLGWGFAPGASRGVFINFWQNSTPMLCRFYSAFTEVWFRSVLRSFVILIASTKLNVLQLTSALTNLRWHCSATMYIHDVTESWGSLESRPNEAVIWGSLFWGNNNKDQYTGMAACLNYIWSIINHCHCVFIDIVLDSFLIIGVHSFDRRRNGAGHFWEDRLGKQWQGPIQRHDRLSELYSIECYIFSLTFNSFLIIRVHSFASRPNFCHGCYIWRMQLLHLVLNSVRYSICRLDATLMLSEMNYSWNSFNKMI